MLSVRLIIVTPAHLCKLGGHFVARFLYFCYRWRENRLQGEEGCRGSFLPCYGCVLILLVVPLLLRCSSTQCPAYRGMHKADARRNQTSQASSRYERRPNLRIKIRTEYTHAKSNPRQAARKHPRVLCHAASITLTAEATPQSKSTLH